MKKTVLVLCLSFVMCLISVISGARKIDAGSQAEPVKFPKKQPERPVHRESIEWCNVWIPHTDKDELPRVLLVGDSITQQYFNTVERELAGKVYCARLTTSACVADPLFPIQLRSVIEQYQFDVIQVNNGLHGMGYTEKEYKRGFGEALTLIREKQLEAKIIIALSTPTKAGGPKADLIPRIEARNRIVRELADSIDAQTNDLFTPMQGHPEYYRDDYHFHNNAISIQAKGVAKTIREISD